MRVVFSCSLLMLFLFTTSCLDEAATTLTPEVPQVTEVAPESTTNFLIEGIGLQVNYGYVVTSTLPEGAGFIHHLFLTEENVGADVRLQGRSATFTVSFYSESATDLTGRYEVGGEAFVPGNASNASFFRDLDYSTDRNFNAFQLREGVLELTKEGEAYTVAFVTTNNRWLYEAEGTFTGEIQPVVLETEATATDLSFQGPNHLSYGDRDVALNHAYLQRRGSFSNGMPRYRLYLSEHNIAPDEANLTGRSDLIFFYVDHTMVAQEGTYSFNTETRDFIGALLGGVESAYYCKNMDFTTMSADEDIPATKGALVVKHNDGELQVAFSVDPVTGEATNGIFRGELVHLD